MKIIPRLESLSAKKLVGQALKMSLINNQTAQLWGSFGPKIKHIKNRLSIDKISMQVYPPSYFSDFSPEKSFEKWATVEVAHFEEVGEELHCFLLPEGDYAVFDYKGESHDPSIFEYIFRQWLPQSPYEIDDRPHFELLGEKYKNNDPMSEEEIWIPIKKSGIKS